MQASLVIMHSTNGMMRSVWKPAFVAVATLTLQPGHLHPKGVLGFVRSTPLSSTASWSSTSTCAAPTKLQGSADHVALITEAGKEAARIGFGCYRVSRDVPEHRESLTLALKGGVSLIDASANYGDGLAEELVGEVVQQLTEEGSLQRQDVFLVSKFGYIQGQNLLRYNSGEVVTPETVHYGDNIKHCIHPDFMRDQLSRSLDRMRTDRLDVMLLHNPEYYLSKNAHTTKEGEQHRPEMFRRIKEAFFALEHEVQNTRSIRGYGISSNSFSVPPDDPTFLPYHDLTRMAKEAAKEVAGGKDVESGFRVIQLPINLVETEALRSGILNWALESNISVMVNRPINAFLGREAYRLADTAGPSETYAKALQEAKHMLQEAGFEYTLRVVVDVDEDLKACTSVFQFENWLHQRYLPPIRQAVQAESVADRPLLALQTWIDALSGQAHYLAGLHTRQAMKERGYDIPEDRRLQDFAVEYLLEQPGISVVLLGARKPEYVQDVTRILHRQDQ